MLVGSVIEVYGDAHLSILQLIGIIRLKHKKSLTDLARIL